MKVMLFCGVRSSSERICRIMLEKGVQIVGCVFEEQRPNRLSRLCDEHDIPCYTNDELYCSLSKGELPKFDYGISYLYHRILKKDIIDFSENHIINFHPAPIEIHRGVAACSYCLLKGYDDWAVTAHYVTPGIDDGDIIMQRKFSIKGLRTGVEAEKYIQEHSIKLFEEVLDLLLSGDKLSTKKQDLSSGHYFSRKELEREKLINDLDSTEDIERKIMSLWLPPYHGACIERNGVRYTLINEELLKEIAQLYENEKNQN